MYVGSSNADQMNIGIFGRSSSMPRRGEPVAVRHANIEQHDVGVMLRAIFSAASPDVASPTILMSVP